MAQEGTTLLVNDSSELEVHAMRCSEDRNEGQDCEGEGGPSDETAKICGKAEFPGRENVTGFDVRRGMLVIKDGPQCPGDDGSASKVPTRGGIMCVCGGSTPQDESESSEDD